MNALLLPGNNPAHEVWVEELKHTLKPYFHTINTQHYKHWRTGEAWANVSDELGVARSNTQNLSPYVIVAKSIGTVIALRGVAEEVLRPVRILLLGVPLENAISSGDFVALLHEVSLPIDIIQNKDDPIASFAKVAALIDDTMTHVTLKELPGTTHDYIDFAAIASYIQPTLTKYRL